jgi:hypothetical protein
VATLAAVARRLTRGTGLSEAVPRSASRGRSIVRARRLFCQVATGMGQSGAAVARFLGVSTSAVNRLATSIPLPEVARYLQGV